MEAPDFWTDAQVSTNKMKELKSMKDDVSIIDKLEDLYKEIKKLDKYWDKYKDKYEKFNKRFNYLDDAHASKRALEKIIK